LGPLGGCAGVQTAKAFSIPVLAGTDTADGTVDYKGFSALATDVGAYRESRRVTLAAFKAMAAKPGVMILDARSKDAFARGHIKGAVNLPFTDFTAQSLKETIGDPGRPILIYCNNNFANNAQPVLMKAPALALNIPTFINLYGYGFKNIYELRDVVDFNDPAVEWVKSPS
jgi:phage shock protein E